MVCHYYFKLHKAEWKTITEMYTRSRQKHIILVRYNVPESKRMNFRINKYNMPFNSTNFGFQNTVDTTVPKSLLLPDNSF